MIRCTRRGILQAGGSALAFEPLAAWKSSVDLGASWYVDPNATGTNDGTSWTDAWTAWDSINWPSISPGDTIYISGGIGSQTYGATAGIEILASGTAAKPITIKRGVDPGHNGEPIFDGSGSSVSVVGIRCSKSYVSIDGIAARNFGAACFYLNGATGCVVQNCMGEVGTAPGNDGSATSSAAFTAYQAVNCTFRNNAGRCSQVL